MLGILLKFQFHKGTIRTLLELHNLFKVPHFNSIKVRLELLVVLLLTRFALFQFHKGTIRTRAS